MASGPGPITRSMNLPVGAPAKQEAAGFVSGVAVRLAVHIALSRAP
jgi:hypothetical protein